jgi:uncharacterized protein YegP (UPF0339 family)
MSSLTLTIYQDKANEFRWNMRRCGRIVAESGEGYRRKHSLLKTVHHLFGGARFRTDDLTQDGVCRRQPATL